MLNRISRQLILGLFWFGSAYLAIAAVLPWEWAWRCGWLNLIIGMMGLLLITQTREGDDLFYRGPREGRSGSFVIALVWALPVVGLMVAVLWWIMRLLGFFNW